jgi:hypothetical protein
VLNVDDVAEAENRLVLSSPPNRPGRAGRQGGSSLKIASGDVSGAFLPGVEIRSQDHGTRCLSRHQQPRPARERPARRNSVARIARERRYGWGSIPRPMQTARYAQASVRRLITNEHRQTRTQARLYQTRKRSREISLCPGFTKSDLSLVLDISRFHNSILDENSRVRTRRGIFRAMARG